MAREKLYLDVPSGVHYPWPTDREVSRRLNLPRYIDLEGCPACNAAAGQSTGPKSRYVEGGECVGCLRLQFQREVHLMVPAPLTVAQGVSMGLDWYYGGDRHNGVLCADGPHLRRSHVTTGACLECRANRKGPRALARAEGQRYYSPAEACPECGQVAPRDVVSNRCTGCLPHGRARGVVVDDARTTEASRMVADCPDLVLSRADARGLGLPVYRTGEPCAHGHMGYRYVSTGACIACLRARPRPLKA